MLQRFNEQIGFARGGECATLQAGFELKTLHKYLLRQILASLLLTVVVFAFVVLLMNLMKDVLPRLLAGHMPVDVLARALALEMPFACVYALPMGLITATLLTFGRFSADLELTAARASGISLLSLVVPILGLSLLCCGLSAWLNMDLGPRSRVQLLGMLYDLAHEKGAALIPEGQMVSLNGVRVYTARNRDGNLEDVSIYRMENETNWNYLVHAERAHVETNHGPDQLVLMLNDVHVIDPQGRNVSFADFPLRVDLAGNEAMKPKISDMTFYQLQQELDELQGPGLTPANLMSPAALADLQHLNLTVKTNASPTDVKALLQDAAKKRRQQIGQVRVAIHQQTAFSFACFGFALVGIPLGIRVHRRETNIGILMALVLVAVYYGLVMLANSLSGRPELYPYLIMWIPNFAFQIVGAVLLWRANRGF